MDNSEFCQSDVLLHRFDDTLLTESLQCNFLLFIKSVKWSVVLSQKNFVVKSLIIQILVDLFWSFQVIMKNISNSGLNLEWLRYGRLQQFFSNWWEGELFESFNLDMRWVTLSGVEETTNIFPLGLLSWILDMI